MSDERLLTCPFCGGEANCSDYYGEDCIFEYLVICLDCGVSTQTFLTEEEAIEAWNTRKPMERIVERLEDKFVSTWDCGYEGGYKDAIVDAIKIVKME